MDKQSVSYIMISSSENPSAYIPIYTTYRDAAIWEGITDSSQSNESESVIHDKTANTLKGLLALTKDGLYLRLFPLPPYNVYVRVNAIKLLREPVSRIFTPPHGIYMTAA
jgi:hypothetical protein